MLLLSRLLSPWSSLDLPRSLSFLLRVSLYVLQFVFHGFHGVLPYVQVYLCFGESVVRRPILLRISISRFRRFRCKRGNSSRLCFQTLALRRVTRTRFLVNANGVFSLCRLVERTSLFLLSNSRFTSSEVGLIFLPTSSELMSYVRLLRHRAYRGFL